MFVKLPTTPKEHELEPTLPIPVNPVTFKKKNPKL